MEVGRRTASPHQTTPPPALSCVHVPLAKLQPAAPEADAPAAPPSSDQPAAAPPAVSPAEAVVDHVDDEHDDTPVLLEPQWPPRAALAALRTKTPAP